MLVKRTQRMIKSPYHGQTCEVKSPSYARLPPPLPQRLNIDRCIMVKRHFGKLLHHIYTPTFVFSRVILLLILFSSVFIALDCSTAFCPTSLHAFMKFARSNLLLFDGGIAYPLIQPDYNLDISSWAVWFACKGKT